VKKLPLYAIAHARSGDKGDGSNVGVLAYDDAGYAILREWLSPERVKAHFSGIVRGKVERFEMPNLRALNFLLHDSLGGGGSASLKTDAQGKTHAMAALADRIIEQGRSVYFVPTYQLVQDLLAAKRDLELPRALRKLDRFDVLILDDLGYLKQRANEAEVLFTLIAERYERRSIIITSNMVFSQWEEIFQSPMATAAAIDRIVHHSVIAEFDVSSYRTEAAQEKAAADQKPAASRRRAKK